MLEFKDLDFKTHRFFQDVAFLIIFFSFLSFKVYIFLEANIRTDEFGKLLKCGHI